MGLQSRVIHQMTELKQHIFKSHSYMSVQSVLCPEVHRASCIHDNDSNKCVECHVSDTSGNTGDILSRKLPVQFPQDVDTAPTFQT